MRATGHYSKFRVDPQTGNISFHGHVHRPGEGRNRDDFIPGIGRFLYKYIYIFRAERVPFEPCRLGEKRELATDARNLADALHQLQENLEQTKEFNELVREVLPEIQQVGTQRINRDHGEVVIWTDKNAVARNDLAFKLKESGAGVGQVLAILNVIITSKRPQTIIIDEPQGFLHPGAVRKLVEVLRRNAKSKHQIIISTHSPTVITSADPSTITLVRQEGPESILEKINIKKVKRQQNYLGLIGARLSDVFGYDSVLWVEGETEEICFPIILRELSNQPLLGTAIIRVQHTGDFNRKDAKNVIRIYERLSQLEGGLVPPLVGFIFDKETRTEPEQDDLRRLSRDSENRTSVHFITKRLYENYLLHPAAITAVINSIEGFSKRKISERRVHQWFKRKTKESKYYKPLKVPNDNEDWTSTINGALLLTDLFSELSKGSGHFDKTEHSVELTEWLVNNEPESLNEVLNLLVNILREENKESNK